MHTNTESSNPFNNYLNAYVNDYTYFSENAHEQIVYFQDPTAGLQSIVGIHDTTLGPAVGGLRFYSYQNEKAALKGVLRISRSMTFKASLADLDVCGGKAVLLKKPHVELSEAILRKYGDFVERLNGHLSCL